MRAISVVSLVCISCQGFVSEGGPSATGELPRSEPPPPPAECGTASLEPGRVRLHRLTRFELDNTIADLTGVDMPVVERFPADESAAGFDNQASALTSSPLHLEQLYALAEETAAAMLSGAPREMVVRGDPASDPRGAAAETLARFVPRAYRRPAEPGEIDRLLALYDEGVANGLDFDSAIALPLRAILGSPFLLFREPVPAASDASPRRLDGFMLASRLSYFVWSSMPDDALFEAARTGALDREDGVRTEVARMLGDDKARRFVRNFAGQWLDQYALAEAHPDPAIFGDFDEALRASMATESELFFASLLEPGASYRDLLAGDYTFADARLAEHYGVDASDFARVELPNERIGFLTQGSFLTITSHPDRTSLVRRGKWVLEQLLCSPPPPPPPGVEALPVDEGAAQDRSLREIVEQHRADPVCATCHASIDPIGFGLEHFDAIGAYRETDEGFAIDSRVDLATASGTVMLDGAEELSRALADDPRYAECLAEKILTYAIARAPREDERCLVRGLAASLEDAPSLVDLVTAVTATGAFTHINPEVE